MDVRDIGGNPHGDIDAVMEKRLTAAAFRRPSISMNIETAAQQLDALGNPTRLRIYRLLVRAGRAGLPVASVQGRIGMPASTLSHHLKKLMQVGLVRQERDGNTLWCQAVYPAMTRLIGFLVDECCADECGDGDLAASAGPERAE
ncbi:hypothetical protein GCM10010961_34020 [Pseudodonghicola xiamenensis]|uniref:HTH arsR-type domain-containing protein n=1 Tax=Pseudodonghicola xiamenensis TaxID=337702 RepID=A0A8J3H9V2_9RHOB|nr:hypothetical protein GCM10010961_34020 [Pseudodonghicola xiamenensis]